MALSIYLNSKLAVIIVSHVVNIAGKFVGNTFSVWLSSNLLLTESFISNSFGKISSLADSPTLSLKISTINQVLVKGYYFIPSNG